MHVCAIKPYAVGRVSSEETIFPILDYKANHIMKQEKIITHQNLTVSIET